MTETYLKDPLGMLSRAPELEAVARADAGVAAALARGSAHGLYRTLWWGRLTGRLKAHRIVIDQLLSHRRLFVAKAGAPVLGSLNGIGATVYGDSDHDTDGTYVKTHFLILVFVPIFPFAQYLVSDAPEKGKAWYFLGKVPLSGPVWFWNRLVVTGVIVGMGAGLFQGFYATKHHDIQIVNGLPKGVHVRAGEKEIDVPAFGREVVNLPAGRQSIKVSADSKEIESGSFDIKPGSSVQIWNVLGAAPIFRETVYYTANGVKPPESQAKIHCGDVQIDTPWADYVFIEPPATLSLPENQASEAKQHVGIDSGGIAACVGAFAAPERSAAAVALAKGLVTVDDSVSSLGQAILLLQLGGKPELAVPMLKEAVEKHDNSVEHHRLYQSTAQSLGAGAGLLDDYRKRREAQPDSADAAYLYDRLLPRVEVAEDARKLVARYPDHIQINRLAAFVLMREHRFDEALPVLERIQKLDQDEWLNFALDHVTTLAALGRKDDAVKLAQSAFRTGTGDQKSRLAAFVSWLGPPASAAGDTLIGTIPGITPQQRTHWRLRFWLAANDVNVSSVAIAPHPLLPKLEVDAHFHPDEALVQIATTEPDALLFLGPEVLTLFKGEALRQHNEAASKPIDQALETLGLPISDLNAYLNEGAWSTDVDELPLSIHASLYAARSRSGRVPPAEKARLRDLARQCDPAGGFAQRALATWPVV